ncbi:YxlC family protein [Bacillus sp. JCM 19034]|uniref:YxlC family protein n=1 Tax=Bacillus sp. JCM 19034 TaxID=1481928 RepID=UPI00078468B9|nr:YxlC family protein [Bacillus sp. JCM 19034]
MSSHEQRVIQSLKQDWEQVDRLGDEWNESVHKQQLFEQLQKEKQRAYQKELYLFILIAVCIMIGSITIIYQSFHAYFILQIAALVGAPLLLLHLNRKKKKVTS